MLAAATTVLLAGCSSGADQPIGGPTPTGTGSQATAGIDFTDCSGQFRQAISSAKASKLTFSCGRLAVPLDYSQPAGPTIGIYVLKIHSKSQRPADRLGSLLINPGGPGSSGVFSAASLVTSLSQTVLDHFDIVGFDPRGVGLSDPVQCTSDSQKDLLTAANPDVRTAAGRAAARRLYTTVANACVAKYGTALGDYNTEATARDMDRIRAALGDSLLNYLGFSYGTELGAVYAHLFPSRIRTAVLDGAVDPEASELTQAERQVQGFHDAFDQFAADCRTRPACAVLGDPRAAVTALIAAADRSPIHSTRPGETRAASGGVVITAVVAALYNSGRWDALGQALVAARKGDSAQLFALADSYSERDESTGHYTNLLDANLVISCNDSTLNVTDDLVATTAAQWSAKYPIFGRNAAASLYACVGWPASDQPLPSSVSAPGAPPILVVGTLHDPATPYADTAALAKAIGSGVVLTWDGQGHTAYLRSQCVTEKVDEYLVTTKAPAITSCPLS